MSQEQIDGFRARRARVLEKHAARDPEWQKLRRARRPRVLQSLTMGVLGLAVVLVGMKSFALAYYGPDGYAGLVAPIAERFADQPTGKWIAGRDVLTGPLADWMSGAIRRSG